MQALFFIFSKYFLECPVAVSEDGDDLTIGALGVDIHGVAADHEVLMDHGIIDTQLTALLQSLVLE